MAEKQINIFVEDTVAAGATVLTESTVAPVGAIVQVTEYGGCDVAIGDGKGAVIALQYYTGSAWVTIRGWSGCINFASGYEYEGNGVRKIRLVRINKSAAPKQIMAWVRGTVATKESYL